MWWTPQDAWWHSIRIDTCKNIRRCQHTQDKQKLPSPPAGAETWHTGEADCLGNITNALNIHTDVQSNNNYLKAVEITSKTIRSASEAKEVKLAL